MLTILSIIFALYINFLVDDIHMSKGASRLRIVFGFLIIYLVYNFEMNLWPIINNNSIKQITEALRSIL